MPTTESGRAYQQVVDLKREAQSATRAIAAHLRALRECAADSPTAKKHHLGLEFEEARLAELQRQIKTAWNS